MKKIIASILAMAMVLSMFTMVFSANTEAKTNYTEQVEDVKDLLETLLKVGPKTTNFLTNGALDLVTDNSQQRAAVGKWTLADGTAISATIAAEIGRLDLGVDTSKGVDADKIFTDEAAFLEEVSKSKAINEVVAAFGYETVAEAVEDLKLVTKYRTEQWKTLKLHEVEELAAHLNVKMKDNDFQWDDPEYVNQRVDTVKDKKNASFTAVVDYLKANKPEALPQEITEFSDAQEVSLLVTFYVASAAYFGTHADAEWFSAEFNENRTVIYDTAIDAATDLINAFRKQSTSANCPYIDELNAFVAFEKSTEAKYGDPCYNESYGINPWVVTHGEDFNFIANVGIVAGYQWMSFADIATYSEKAAQLLTSLQSQLRAAAIFNVNGKLYGEFLDVAKNIEKTFKDLCWELVGGKNAADPEYDYAREKAAAEAIIKLWQLEVLYTLYIEENIDLYAQTVENISALYNLKGQIEIARQILNRVGYTPAGYFANEGIFWKDGSYTNIFFPEVAAEYEGDLLKMNTDLQKDRDDLLLDVASILYDGVRVKFFSGIKYLAGIDAEAVYKFIDSIELNVAQLAPAAGQKIYAEELAAGSALYNKANNLLAFYANAELATYNQLAIAVMNFGNLLPSSLNENAVAVFDVDFMFHELYTKHTEDIYGEAEYVFDDSIYYNLEFAPVAYAYLQALAALENAIDAVEAEVNGLGTDAPELEKAVIYDLYDAMQKYDFLTYRRITWKEEGLELDDDDCQLYFLLLTGYASASHFVGGESADSEDNTDVTFGAHSFLARVMGDPTGYEGYAFDYAVRNYANFYEIYEICRDTYGTEWPDYADGWYDYADEDAKLDFSGDFSILDVTTTNNAALVKKLIAELEAAAALLCVNNTQRVAMYTWVNEQLAGLFGLVYAEELATWVATEFDAPDAIYLGNALNYTEGTFEALVDAMTALSQLVDRYYSEVTGIELDWDNMTFAPEFEAVTNRATPAKLEAAFEAVKEALYKLVTSTGAACLDAFFAQIEVALATKVYDIEVSMDDVEDVMDILDTHVLHVGAYFPAEMALRPYVYFAYTLNAIANYPAGSNLYSNYVDNLVGYDEDGDPVYQTNFEVYFLNAFEAAVAGVNAIVTGQYPTALREDAAKLAFFANDILAGINDGDFGTNNWNANNMPLWYALELSQYLVEYAAEAATQHANALQALKAEVLVPVIEEAETIQTAFLAKAMPIVIDYNAAQNVMANSKNGALYIYDAEEIKAAAEALAAEVELAKAELGEAVYTVEDVLALIDAAVATTEARATGMAADLKALRVAAAEAKTEIAAGEYNQTTYVDKVVAAANAALKALVDVELADKTLYTPASYEAYEAAYNTLMDVVDINADVELTVAEALAAVKAAEAELVLIADATGAMYEAAKAAYEAALTVDGTKYTAESYAAFTAAVEALKAAIDNYASDADLQAAIVNVKVAEVQLVAAPIDEVGTLDD